MRYYRNLTEIYPRELLESSNYYIARGLATQEFIDQIRVGKPKIKNLADYFEPGKEHLFLISKTEGVMMSDYPDEKITNQNFIDNAHGDVLIFGLGLGLIIFPLLDEEDVRSITIVEMDPELPNLVGPIIKQMDSSSKVNILHGNAFDYADKLNQKYDTIYFDIWARITDESFDEMEKLHEMYRPLLKSEDGYIDSWRYDSKNDSAGKVNKKKLLKLAETEINWLRFYSTPESIYNLSEESDFYSELEPIGYAGNLIKLDNCCIPCIVKSEAPIDKKTKVSDLKIITSTRDKDNNKYSPLEAYWNLYPESRVEIINKLKFKEEIVV
jgi:hypothetical protein